MLLLMLLLVASCCSALDPLERPLHAGDRLAQPPPVTLEEPETVISEQAVRLDLTTTNVLYHAHVVSITVCSAVDIPWQQFDRGNPSGTGCNSPGFIGREIFNSKEGTKDPEFQVRQRARSIYVRKVLVDRRSPTVYMEIRVNVDDELGNPIHPMHRGRSLPVPWVLTTRYSAPERAASLEGVPLVDLKGRVPITFSAAPTWVSFSIMGVIIGTLGLLCIFLIVHRLRKRRRRKGRDLATISRKTLVSWMYSAQEKGFFSGAKPARHNV